MVSRAQLNCLFFQESSLCIVEMVRWEFWSTGNKPRKAFFFKSPSMAQALSFLLPVHSLIHFFSHELATPTFLFYKPCPFHPAFLHLSLLFKPFWWTSLYLCSLSPSTQAKDCISRLTAIFLGTILSHYSFAINQTAFSILVTPLLSMSNVVSVSWCSWVIWKLQCPPDVAALRSACIVACQYDIHLCSIECTFYCTHITQMLF